MAWKEDRANRDVPANDMELHNPMEELETEGGRSRGSIDFVESSILDTTIPLDGNLNIEDALSGSVERIDEGNESPLAAIPQRQTLFFDETVTIYVILQTPYFDERTLRSYLGRLAIYIEAQVVNTPAESHEGDAGHEIIYSGSVQESEDPLIVVQGPDENGGSGAAGHVLVVWKITAFLSRPRLRLQNPSVEFSATANLKPAEQLQNFTAREEYLPSQIPSGINLLEAFSGDPAMGGIKPRLSALRVSRVTPITQTARDLMRPLRNISRKTVKVFPAINARVKYSRPNTTPQNPVIIVSVDLDITPFANCQIVLRNVELKMNSGSVEDLNAISGIRLPVTCLPQDDVTFLYRLIPAELDTTDKSQIRTLDISINAIMKLSMDCESQISMNWTTTLPPVIPPVNPGFGHPTQPIQRANRPAQLSISSPAEVSQNLSSLAATRPDALPSVEFQTSHQRNPSVADFGVTMTFTTAQTSPIHPGVAFVWSVFIVNRSDRPRKLALMVMPKRRRTEARLLRPPSTGYGDKGRDPKVADAVVDENIVYAMQKNSAVDTTEIVCLSTDTRVGPLAPSACCQVELKFMALKTGFVGIEAVRVVDLGTQEHVDIRDLPSIVVEPFVE